MYSKLYLRKVHNLRSFGICIHLYSIITIKVNKHFFHPQKFWSVLVYLLSNFSAYFAFHFNSSIGILAVTFCIFVVGSGGCSRDYNINFHIYLGLIN